MTPVTRHLSRVPRYSRTPREAPLLDQVVGGGPGAAGEGDAGGLSLLVVVLPAAAGDQPGLGVGEPGSWEEQFFRGLSR